MPNKAIFILMLIVVAAGVLYIGNYKNCVLKSSATPWNISHYYKALEISTSQAIGNRADEFSKLPFTSLGDIFVNEKYESKFSDSNVEISFPFSGVPVNLKIINGQYNFAFRKIFDGDLYRLIYDNSGHLLKEQHIEVDGVDFPIFRAAAISGNNLYWVIYNNKKMKNYLINVDHFQEDAGDIIELPSFYPPAGKTYEMEPPVFLSENDEGGLFLIAGALQARINDGKVNWQRLSECETAVEVVFPEKGPVVLCRGLEGRKQPYLLIDVNENRIEYLKMDEGIPYGLQYNQENRTISFLRAKSPAEILNVFLWDIRNNQQGGVLEFGVNNVEGRIPWSQIYYLNGLMDALLLVNLHKDAVNIFGEISDDLIRRVIIEIRSLDHLLEQDKGFRTKGFTHDRSLALFAVQTSRLLLLFDRYAEEFPDAPRLNNTEKLRQMVSELNGHIEYLANEGEDSKWMKKGVYHLRWPKCSAFYFDGMAVPFNHQNEWAYSLFNAARVRGISEKDIKLDSQRDVIGFFMSRLGNRGGFPSKDKWYYWYGHAYDGWADEDNLSCNMRTYEGDHGLAWISFRTIDLMSVMSALDFMSDLNRKKLLDSGYDAVKHGDVYPFAARSLLAFGIIPQIQLPILERYYRATAPWELSNTPWALTLGISVE